MCKRIQLLESAKLVLGAFTKRKELLKGNISDVEFPPVLSFKKVIPNSQ
jgi:hypothetical protein